MARIFLSHSSGNNAEAIALRDWLISHGWDDLFLDLDPERGLKAGDRWQAALKRAAERCELVIFLVSPEWAASKWCLAEFLLAKNLNKRIFGVVVEPTPLGDMPVEMTAEWWLVDLTAGNRDYKVTVTPPPGDKTETVDFAEDGLEGLRIGLMQAGVDARYFAWPPEDDSERAPYRGLEPLEAKDAGIFFGRDGPTIVGLDLLRGLREAAPPRLLVILGASGAGKSSFLRAGLLPRLARESQHFLPLPVIRPERAALSGEAGLIASLEMALKEAGVARTRAEIRKAIKSGAESVASLLRDLVKVRTSIHTDDCVKAGKAPMLVLAIDQAEELFHVEGAEEAPAFLDLLGKLAAEDNPALIALFTIRSDSYERLQTARSFQGVRQRMLSLPPMPKGAYAEVIKGPPRRLEGTKRALEIDAPLVDALLADIEEGGAKDALPLLAFTLEWLYREHGGGGELKLSDYEELGRIRGSIEAAVERALKAADTDPKIPRDREARLALLRRGLIPWLAGIDPDTGSPRRRIARHSEIPAESRPLIDLLVEQRLLSTDVAKDTGEDTIEPVHEALLRQWGLLQGWLAEDAGLLSVLGGIKRASRDWAANDKGGPWLTHSGERLKAAEQLTERPDLAANLEPTDRDYLAACRKAERAAAGRKRRAQALVGVLGLSILAGVIGWLNQDYLQERWHWFSTIRPYTMSEFRPHVLTAEAEQALKPKARFKECAKDCPEMVVVPAGQFTMGSPEDQGEDDERPQHEVTIPTQFAVSKFEVTFDDWDACVAYGDCDPSVSDNGWVRGERPVINVTWADAQHYVAWLSRMTGKNYRLLSEAEWEYVVRAGSATTYPWGDKLSDEIAESGIYCGGCGSQPDRTQTITVGSFKPNAFGVYDMLGNVSEWVEDVSHYDYDGAPTDGSAWVTGDEPDSRVLRGGSYYLNDPKHLRPAWRSSAYPDTVSSGYGFRIARTLSHEGAQQSESEKAEELRAQGNLEEASLAFDKAGDMLITDNKTNEALNAYRGGLAIRERLARTNPNNADRHIDVLSSHDKIGSVLLAQKKFDEALKYFRDALAIIGRQAKTYPDHAAFQGVLAAAFYDKVGEALMSQKEFLEALDAYRESVAIKERLAKADPNDVERQVDLSKSHRMVAQLLLRQNKLEEAIAAVRKSLAVTKHLAEMYPDNTDLKSELGTAYGELAYSLVLGGHFAKSLEASDEAMQLVPENILVSTNRAHALMFLGRTGEARALYLQYRGETDLLEEKSWEKVILDDFAALRKAGLDHPLMDEIAGQYKTN